MGHLPLQRDEWIAAARRVLLREGPAGLRVERLARDLGVTKGSFYWHFKNRGALLDALLVEWEEETSLLDIASSETNLRDALVGLFGELQRRVIASERGESPSDAAMFSWAAASPKIARRVNRAEARRIELLQQLTGQPELATFAYLAYLGFIMRRRREPAAAGDFPRVAAIMLELLAPAASSGPLLERRAGTPSKPTSHESNRLSRATR